MGSPIKLDEHTAKLKKGSYTRVCVEIDLQKSLTPGIFIRVTGEGFWQRIEYESLLSLCVTCGKIGHKMIDCPDKPNQEAQAMEDQRAPSGGTGSSEARSECQESRKEQQPENHKLECCSSLKETEEGGFRPVDDA